MKTPLCLTIAGSGDAFSSGGRLQSAIHIASAGFGLLVDCGATLLPALQKSQLSTEQIDAVVISHLHGDHMGGLPFLLLDALFVQQRRKPLNIFGPTDLEERTRELCRLFYPGALDQPLPFALNFHPYAQGADEHFSLKAQPAVHGNHSAAHSLRIEIAGRSIAYSGDSAWHPGLISLAANTDLFICECCSYDQKLPGHTNYQTLIKQLPQLETKRLLLTHCGSQMDLYREQIDLPVASDGLVINL